MTGLSTRVRRAVADRDGGICIRCRSRRSAQIHHRRPRGRGGSSLAEANMPANLVSLCEPCHSQVESFRTRAYATGWLLRHDLADPAQVPLINLRGVPFYLTDDYRILPNPSLGATA